MEEKPDVKLKKSVRNLKIEIFEEIRRYKCIGSVSTRIIFDP